MGCELKRPLSFYSQSVLKQQTTYTGFGFQTDDSLTGFAGDVVTVLPFLLRNTDVPLPNDEYTPLLFHAVRFADRVSAGHIGNGNRKNIYGRLRMQKELCVWCHCFVFVS